MDPHGYVYAFAHQPNGWIKVGMTEKNDEQRCWDRINHYIKQHRLPDEGWEFVGFVATYKTRALETRIRRVSGWKGAFFFPHSFMTYECAKWAVQTVLNFSRVFSQEVGVQERFAVPHLDWTLP